MEKAERIDRVRNSLHSEEELLQRLPEIDAIYDESVREAVIEYFLRYCPDYFWEKPASASGNYHPVDERGKYGTWIHTKRVFFEYSNISYSLLEAHQITEEERAAGKAAALIHDTFNYGWPSHNRDMTTQEHDIIAAAVAKEVTGMPEETIHLVHSHMGPWGEGKVPETQHEWTFHNADNSAAADNHRQAVYFPHPDLLEEWPELQSVEVTEDDEPI